MEQYELTATESDHMQSAIAIRDFKIATIDHHIKSRKEQIAALQEEKTIVSQALDESIRLIIESRSLNPINYEIPITNGAGLIVKRSKPKT